MKNKRGNKFGFTLVEACASVAVGSLLILTIVSLFSVYLKYTVYESAEKESFSLLLRGIDEASKYPFEGVSTLYYDKNCNICEAADAKYQVEVSSYIIKSEILPDYAETGWSDVTVLLYEITVSVSTIGGLLRSVTVFSEGMP